MKIRQTADEIIREYSSEDVLAFNFSKYEGSFKQDEVPTDVINNNNASKEVDEVAFVNSANPCIRLRSRPIIIIINILSLFNE